MWYPSQDPRSVVYSMDYCIVVRSGCPGDDGRRERITSTKLYYLFKRWPNISALVAQLVARMLNKP